MVLIFKPNMLIFLGIYNWKVSHLGMTDAINNWGKIE